MGDLSPPQRNSRLPLAPPMPTQGSNSRPGTSQRTLSNVQYLRGALSEVRKLGV